MRVCQLLCVCNSTESPEVFGMHANANIAFQLQESNSLLDAVISIQPRVTSGGGGDASGSNSTDAIVAALCGEILKQMPPDLSLDEASSGLFERGSVPTACAGGVDSSSPASAGGHDAGSSSSSSKLNSLSVVLGQEVERFRRLSAAMRTSLEQLQAAIKGVVVMSEPLEAAYNALLLNEVGLLLGRRQHKPVVPVDKLQPPAWLQVFLSSPACVAQSMLQTVLSENIASSPNRHLAGP